MSRVSKKFQNFNSVLVCKLRKHRNVLIVLAVSSGAFVLLQSPARADFNSEIQKVTQMSSTLTGISAGMTEAAIAPIGLAAAFGMFKMMILRAV